MLRVALRVLRTLIRSLLIMRPTCNEFQRLLFSICTNLYVFCSTFVWHWYIVIELFYCYFFLCTLSHGWSSDRIILSNICLLCIGLCAFNRPSKGPTNEWTAKSKQFVFIRTFFTRLNSPEFEHSYKKIFDSVESVVHYIVQMLP